MSERSSLLTMLRKRLPMRDLLRVLALFVRRYPVESMIVLGSLMTANILEGIGILALLPLLNVAVGQGHDNWISRGLTNALAAVGLPATLGVLLAVMVALVIFKSALSFIGNKYVGYTMARVQADLRLDFLRAMIGARWSYFTRQPTGRLTNAISSEPDRAAAAILYAVTLLVTLIQGGVYILAAFLVSPYVALAAVVTGLAMVAAMSWFTRMARSAGMDQTAILNSLLARFVDALHGIKPIKAMALERRFMPLLEDDVKKLRDALRKQTVATTAVRSFQEPVATIVMAVLFWRAVQTLGGFQKIAQSMVMQESALWSLNDAIRVAVMERETTAGSAPPRLRKNVVLDRVSFAHGEKEVLRNLSLTIAANRLTAVVGPSGTGKTTVADLCIGLYTPQSGEIRVDGVSLSGVDLHAWRETIGYVPQETTLFVGSIFANVTLGDELFTEADAEAALRAAGAWDFIASLPQGMHNPVGERGLQLSGGQRQRIAIARAMIRKPSLLILDEATTALDPTTERAICATLRELTRSVTILAISHQPAIVDTADVVYQLSNGAAVAVERDAARATA